MADKKISELNSLTGANAADGDLVAIVDVTATETKKITRSEFFTNVPSIDVTGTVTADGLTVDGSSNITKTSAAAEVMPLVVQNQDSSTSTAVALGFANTSLADQTTSNTKIGAIRTNSVTSGDTDLFINTQALGGSLRRALFASNGDISFYEDTGTTPKFFWDASAERLGINVTDPIYPLEVQGQAGIELYNGTGGGGVLNFRPSLGDANKYNLSISSFDHSGGGVGPADGLSLNGFDGVSIATGSSTTRQERMRIDASGNVGIGTSSPAAKLHIEDDAGSAFRVENITNTSFASSLFVDDTGAGLTITNYGSAYASGSLLNVGAGGVALSSTTDMAINVSGAKTLRFGTNSTERLRIDSSGNVGIGTTSPSSKLQIDTGSATNSTAVLIGPSSGTATVGDKIVLGFPLQNTGGGSTGNTYAAGIGGIQDNSGTNTGALGFYTQGAAGDGTPERMRITSGGTLQIAGGGNDNVGEINMGNTAQSANRFQVRHQSSAWYLKTVDSEPLVFGTANTERMRIDASGNLLVGKTSADYTTAGVMVEGDGTVSSVKAGVTGVFNRLTTDGDIMQFRKDGTTVGSIGSDGGGVRSYYAGNNVGISPYNGIIYPTNGSGTAVDNTADLGASAYRFKNLYLSGGVYLGGTGSANHLDDYEEGTWTPVFTGLTIGNGTISGTYTKIGRQVTIVFGFACGSTTSVGTLGNITGLPFAAANIWSGYIKVHGVAFDSGSRWYEAVAVIGSGDTNAVVPSITNYNAAISASNPMTWANNDNLVFTATYFTA